MPPPLRHAVCAALAGLAVTAALAPAADARAALRCPSADLRFPFRPGGPDDFGVFKLRITGGRCATAHRVAKAWMREFEAIEQSSGPLRYPREAGGFRFTLLRTQVAQELRLRGRRRSTAIRFDYRVPSG